MRFFMGGAALQRWVKLIASAHEIFHGWSSA
jgi:hypothetical protein